VGRNRYSEERERVQGGEETRRKSSRTRRYPKQGKAGELNGN
jgi:hypothetical protein